MARFEEADKRLFLNVWICMKCNAKNRSGTGKPRKCRKCGSSRFRLKHKVKKSASKGK
ncbi:MAG: 50S ribosomal protein L40e [Candidatus ainarchaeum sp.]|nr:50S ribosomal protein L40e [Candidatus ainarchaeum sp.]